MKYRVLGRTGIQVSEIGYGSWAIGGDAWGPQDDHHSKQAINAALDAGCTFIDTALSYGSGHSERLIGQVLKDRGQVVALATKVPPKNEVWGPPPYQPIEEAYPPDWIARCCEESLRNLGVDCLDVLLFHTWSRSWSTETEWTDVIVRLKSEGKIRACGISVNDQEVDAANVQVATGRVDVVEVVYNVFQQLPQYELFPLAAERNVGIIARAPLQAGILTGKYTSWTTFAQGDWRGEWTPPGWLVENVTMASKVEAVAKSASSTMAALALQFSLSHPAVSVVIAGGRDADQVRHNVAAAEGGRLNEEVLSSLYDLWKRGEVHGTYLGSS